MNLWAAQYLKSSTSRMVMASFWSSFDRQFNPCCQLLGVGTPDALSVPSSVDEWSSTQVSCLHWNFNKAICLSDEWSQSPFKSTSQHTASQNKFIMALAQHTHHGSQASFNTMRYKGRDSASGIGRKLSIIRPGATTVVAPKSSGSMTTRGQMNPTFGVSITVSQAGENSQTNGCKHTIVTDVIFKRNKGRRAVSSDPPLNQRSSRVRATSFKILNWHKYYHQLIQLQHKSWIWILIN